MHRNGDGKTVRGEAVAGRKRVFELNRCVALQANLAGKVQRGAFAVDGVLCQPIEGGERHEQRRELGMVDDLKVQLLFRG